MVYKAEIYRNYISNQAKHLYGEISIASIEKNFKLWDYFYSQFFPIDKSARILDLGCGEGAFVYYLQQKGYLNTEGIDISPEQIKSGENLGILNIYQGDVFDFLKKTQNTYDFIIARDVLEHFSKSDIFKILKLAYRSLGSNGKMMIQVPNGEGIWHEKIYYGDFTHETLLSRDSANQVFLSVRFAKVNTYPLEFPARDFNSILRKIVWKGMVLHQKFRKWIATGDGSGIFTPNILVVAEK